MQDKNYEVVLEYGGTYKNKKVFNFNVYAIKHKITTDEILMGFEIDEDGEIYDNYFEDKKIDRLEPLEGDAEELCMQLQLWDLATDYAASILKSEVYP